jgi:dihydrolipoamide dehydrogenase
MAYSVFLASRTAGVHLAAMENLSFDVTILGAGPGGYVAAIRAAQRGKRVALIERDRLGGVCLNSGCIPTKALLRAAEHFDFLKHAADWGFDLGEVKVEWRHIIEKSRAAADKLSRGVASLMKKHHITVLSGSGSFLSPNRIAVKGAEGQAIEVATTHAIIATGGRPAAIPGIEIDGKNVVSSKEAMMLPEIPRSLAVVGAGAVGLEFAYFYSVFGTRIDLIEYCPDILPGGDEEICRLLARSFQRRGIRIHTSRKVVGIERRDGVLRCRLERADGEGAPHEELIESDAVLIATGIRPNVEGLGLEEVGVELERGFIKIDGFCQTSVQGIYAIGDVCGPPALAHAASAEGLLAVHHLAGDDPAPIDYGNVPACIYCQPQVAGIGLSEREARAAGHEVTVGRFPFSANGKAAATGEMEGLVKLIGARGTGEILGAQIIGPEATELIGEIAVARTAELTVHDLHHTIHAHPTLSEAVMEAAADWAGEAVQI